MKTQSLIIGVAVLVTVGLAAPAFAQTEVLYVPNKGSHTVSVIDTATNTVIKLIDLVALTGSTKGPAAVVTTLDGKKAYIPSELEGSVVVLNTQNSSVRTIIDLGNIFGNPLAIALSPDGSTVWVTELFGEGLIAIDTATDTLATKLSINCPAGDPRCAAAFFGQFPVGLEVAPTTVDASGRSGELWVTVQFPGRVEVYDFGPAPSDLTHNRTIWIPGFEESPGSGVVIPSAIDVTFAGNDAYVVAFGRPSVFGLPAVPDGLYVFDVVSDMLIRSTVGDPSLGPGASEVIIATSGPNAGVAYVSNFGVLGGLGFPGLPFTTDITTAIPAGMTLTMGTLLTGGSSPAGMALSQSGDVIYICNIFSGVGVTGTVSVLNTRNGAITIIEDLPGTGEEEIGIFPATPFAFTIPDLPTPPTFDPGPCGSTIPVFAGQEVTFTIAGSVDPTDPGYLADLNGNAVFLDVITLPGGAVMTPGLPLGGASTVSSTFTWTPGAGDVGLNTVTFTLTDYLGQEVQCQVTIDVGAVPPPFFVEPTAGETFTVEADKLLSFPVTLTSAAGAVVTIDLIGYPASLPPGATLSETVPFAGASPATVTFDWTPPLGEVGNSFPLTFTGIDESGLPATDVTVTVVVLEPGTEIPFDPYVVTKLHIHRGKPKKDGKPKGTFDFKGTFGLGSASDGIDPLTEDVTIGLDDFSLTIPAGSFSAHGKHGDFKFKGEINGVKIDARLKAPRGGGKRHTLWEFKFKGKYADMSSIENDVDTKVLIGNDIGEGPKKAKIHK